MGHQVIVDIPEAQCLACGIFQCSIHQLRHDLCQARISLHLVRRAVAAIAAVVFCLFCGQAKDLHVLFAHALQDLHVGAVQGAQRNGAVHHELHVACAACLFAGGRDLLGDIGSRVDELRVADAEVFYKDHLDLAADHRVVIDQVRHGVDQVDDFLGKVIALRRLACKDKGVRADIQIRLLAQAVVQIHDLKHVQKLSLVGVDPLHLNIKHRIGIHVDADFLLNISSQAQLVLPFHLAKPQSQFGIAGILA